MSDVLNEELNFGVKGEVEIIETTYDRQGNIVSVEHDKDHNQFLLGGAQLMLQNMLQPSATNAIWAVALGSDFGTGGTAQAPSTTFGVGWVGGWGNSATTGQRPPLNIGTNAPIASTFGATSHQHFVFNSTSDTPAEQALKITTDESSATSRSMRIEATFSGLVGGKYRSLLTTMAGLLYCSASLRVKGTASNTAPVGTAIAYRRFRARTLTDLIQVKIIWTLTLTPTVS